MSQGTKKIIIVALILVLGFFIYNFASSGSRNSNTTSLQITQRQNVDILSAEIKRALRSVDAIDLTENRLNRDIFGNPVYNSLVDHNTVTPEEPTGRINPFLPYITIFSQIQIPGQGVGQVEVVGGDN
ncbi:MAG TPA: hypothetical protein PKA60_00850 [Candidatus Paceibacterota bacterium]|nr:hypothetical protein [Candidatus Paceibacterota bacterium]